LNAVEKVVTVSAGGRRFQSAGKSIPRCECGDKAKELEDSDAVVHLGARVKGIEGGSQVEALTLEDGKRIPVSGVFIELGAKGVMGLAMTLGIQLDDTMKYIRTDKQQATSVAGIYAAGDICGPPWQVAKAVGEGCVAGINAAGHAKKIAREAG
jgi:thioredoxin reductase (NADPH)